MHERERRRELGRRGDAGRSRFGGRALQSGNGWSDLSKSAAADMPVTLAQRGSVPALSLAPGARVLRRVRDHTDRRLGHRSYQHNGQRRRRALLCDARAPLAGSGNDAS